MILGLFCLSISAEGIWDEARHFKFRHQKLEREYWLYMPENLPEGAPLVFLLHGYSGKAKGYFPALLEEGRRSGFAVCIPNGWPDARGKNCWNVGYPFQEGLKTDDVDFLCRLARHLQKEYGFNRRATFVTGMSNGGEMCYILAARKSDVFRAVAPISGLQMVWAMREYRPQRPVPLMEIHGTLDKTSRWEGDPDNRDGWGEYTSVPVAVGNWVAANGCTWCEHSELPLKTPESNRVILHRYLGGEAEVRLYEVIGGKHSKHEQDMDTAAEIWQFFRQYLP